MAVYASLAASISEGQSVCNSKPIRLLFKYISLRNVTLIVGAVVAAASVLSCCYYSKPTVGESQIMLSSSKDNDDNDKFSSSCEVDSIGNKESKKSFFSLFTICQPPTPLFLL